MADDAAVRIGRLRWRVLVATRKQVAQIAGGTGIDELLQDLQPVMADIQPVGGAIFFGGQQTDTPVTHRIFMRWLNYLDQGTVVFRRTTLPSNQLRTEHFRVRRFTELGGRKRFAMIEAELEKTTTQ